MGYFKVDVKPDFPASLQHSGANMTTGKILADWTEFEIPSGTASLIGINVLYRGVNGADIDPTDFEILWAKGNADGTAPTSLATPGSAIGDPAAGENPWFNQIQGKTFVDASNCKDNGALVFLRQLTPNISFGGTTAAQTNVNLGLGNTPLCLEGAPKSGRKGYDKLYAALLAKATHAYTTSTLAINGAHAAGTTGKVLTVDGISARKAFAAGDVIHDQDDQLLGTVSSVDSATQITLENNIANSVADNKVLYNLNPIVIQCSFHQ